MKFSFGILLLVFLFTTSSQAQAPIASWQKCIGSHNGDYAFSTVPTADGGYIMAGYTESDGWDVMGYHGNRNIDDIWVVKLDNAGNIQWQKCIGGTYMEMGAYIRQLADGSYILAGTSVSVDCNFTGNHGGADYLLVKLKSNGDIEWQKTYGGSRNDYCWAIDVANDGGYVLAGHSESSTGDLTINYGEADYWIIKVDGSGNLKWQKSLGGSGEDIAFSVRATNDGGCVAAGYAQSANGTVAGNHGRRDGWVVKLDNTGNLQWQRALGGSNMDETRSIQLTADGGYIVAGTAGSNDGDVSGNHHQTPGSEATDLWVVKLNSAGIIQWQKCYGGDLSEMAFYIQLTPDGGYVATGTSQSSNGDLTCNAGITDLWVIKISNTGVLEWQRSFGGSYYDEGHCVEPLADGTYVVAGTTCSPNISGYHTQPDLNSTCADFWIIKLTTPGVSQPDPVVSIDPNSALVCAGANATFKASALNVGISPVYQWMRNGMAVGTNSATYTATGFNNNDKITCTVTRNSPCETPTTLSASDAITLQLSNTTIQPVITIMSSSSTICGCAPIVFKATVTNQGASPVYQWKVNGVATSANTDTYISNLLNEGDNITCVYTDNTSCVANGSVVSNAITMIYGSAQTPTINITASGNSVCEGSPVTFTAFPTDAGANPGFQWMINGVAVATTMSFTSTTLSNGDKVNCIVTADPLFPCVATSTATSPTITMTITGKVNPAVTITASSNKICNGTTATFKATTSNAGSNPSYQWKINGVNAGTNSSTFVNSTFANGDQVSCVITTDPAFTCAIGSTASSSAIVMIVINQSNPSITIISSDNDICKGETIAFTASVFDAGAAPAYQWMLNNTIINGNNNLVFINSNLSNGDVIYCTVIPSSEACSTTPVPSNKIMALVNDLPIVKISPADTTIMIGAQVQLRASITGSLGSYQWTPASKLENASTLTPRTVSLTDNTNYELSVKTDKGCPSSATATIKIGRSLIMPNAFTPNGDGINDLFKIPALVSLDLNEFSVFNRWGNRVFTTHDIQHGWDGTFKGKKLDSGVYVFLIKGTDDKGPIFFKGQVMLIR